MTATTYLTEGQATSLDAYLDKHYSGISRYTQKGIFSVLSFGINQWFISVNEPMFYPNCDIINYLKEGFFNELTIDDECNIIVECPSPVNSLEDEDYIKESFDMALAWLPKYQESQRKFEAFQKARDEWYAAQAVLSSLAA